MFGKVTHFVVTPVDHRMTSQLSGIPFETHERISDWACQWTTPNNLNATFHTTQDGALDLFRMQTLHVPTEFDYDTVVQFLLFRVQVRAFNADGFEMTSYRHTLNTRLDRKATTPEAPDEMPLSLAIGTEVKLKHPGLHVAPNSEGKLFVSHVGVDSAVSEIRYSVNGSNCRFSRKNLTFVAAPTLHSVSVAIASEGEPL